MGFQDCKQFFYRRKPPQNIRTNHHIRICQRLNNHYHYATLFDPNKKIPVYSAYLLEAGHGIDDRTWYYQPNINGGQQNMVEEGYGPGAQSQATDADYRGTRYTKGHLNPVSHNLGDAANATCTYTNVVPQLMNHNNIIWSSHEQRLREDLTNINNSCGGQNVHRYVIVGVVASENTVIGNNVNVPVYLWSAYCCAKSNKTPRLEQGLQSGAYIVRHADNANVDPMTVSELETFLHRMIREGIKLFNGGCGEK
ncbi:ENDD1 protein, partial [Amia calva]|nr:ENDD1 protein [Amia calva]